jgi:hypothetical protein
MTIPRQTERRARFLAAFADMPRWETWVKRRADHLAANPTLWEDEYDFRPVSRRIRRDMARQRSRREYRTDHNLPASP